ncbi:SRPBCC family protein [Marinobacter sp. MDS2]|uniref:SRPBCC family protein n=1 Tax=Marinobacter sp. MDS2 TaxID=3065961 RepID=UPI00273BF657|nr:SRPBCC family protein [Marinobacter sp. MDS2]MDP4548514.1 SRPBCC family protein [Marinobacter sp. MDS2]
MAVYTIEIDETFGVPRKKVFALFADHHRFGKMIGAPVKRIKDSDQADPNGAGSVRRVGLGPLSIEETVLEFEPYTLIEYTITSAGPIKNHIGRIHFSDTNDGKTRLRYIISFEDIVPFSGKLIRSSLELGLRRGIRRVPELA